MKDKIHRWLSVKLAVWAMKLYPDNPKVISFWSRYLTDAAILGRGAIKLVNVDQEEIDRALSASEEAARHNDEKAMMCHELGISSHEDLGNRIEFNESGSYEVYVDRVIKDKKEIIIKTYAHCVDSAPSPPMFRYTKMKEAITGIQVFYVRWQCSNCGQMNSFWHKGCLRCGIGVRFQ